MFTEDDNKKYLHLHILLNERFQLQIPLLYRSKNSKILKTLSFVSIMISVPRDKKEPSNRKYFGHMENDKSFKQVFFLF